MYYSKDEDALFTFVDNCDDELTILWVTPDMPVAVDKATEVAWVDGDCWQIVAKGDPTIPAGTKVLDCHGEPHAYVLRFQPENWTKRLYCDVESWRGRSDFRLVVGEGRTLSIERRHCLAEIEVGTFDSEDELKDAIINAVMVLADETLIPSFIEGLS